MNGFGDWSETFAAGPTARLIVLLARLTVVLCLAWAAHAALSSANPRWRVLTWRLAAVGLVGVAGFAATGPLFRLPLLPPEQTIAPPNETIAGGVPHSTTLRRPQAATRSVVTTVPTGVRSSNAVSVHRADTVHNIAVDRAEPARRWSPLRWLAIAWLLGVTWGVTRFAIGMAQVGRIVRAASPVPEWVEADFAQLRRQTPYGGPVSLAQTDAVDVPCSVGLIRQVILLPAGLCDGAQRDELRAALAHELSHFAGGDVRWNAVLHAAAIPLWFHPLAWRVRLAHADACDERCDAEAASRVADPAGYGRALARLALAASGRPAPAVLAMARRSGVGRRLDALRRGPVRGPLRRGPAAAAITAAAALLLLVGGSSLTRSSAQESPGTPATKPEAAKDERKESADRPAGEGQDKEEVEFIGKKKVRVVDPDDRPVVGATVVPWAIRSSAGHGGWTAKGLGGSEPPKLKTDADGVVEVPIPRSAMRDYDIPVQALTCRVEHPDFAESVYNDVPVNDVASDDVATIKVRPGALVEIEAVVGNKQLSIENLYALTGSPSQGWSRKLVAGPDGTPRLPRLPAGDELLRLVFLPPDGSAMFSDVEWLTLKDGETRRLRLEMRPGVRVAGRFDESVPRPVKNGRVVAEVIDNFGGEKRAGAYLSWRAWAKVAEDGTFTLDGLPDGNLQVIALCDGFMAESGLPPEFASDHERQQASSFSRPQVFPLAGRETPIKVAMTPTADAVVRVVGPDGQPVPGATVGFWPNVGWWAGGSQIYGSPLVGSAEMLRNPDRSNEWLGRDDLFSAKADANGVALVRNLPPGRQHFTVQHETLRIAGGDLPYGASTAELSAGERKEVTIALVSKDDPSVGQDIPGEPDDRPATVIPKPRPARTFKTQAGETELAGVVTDEAGQPLAGVQVDAWTWHPGNETTTDAEGRFRLKGFDPREAVEVELSKPDYSPSLYVAQKAGTDDWTIVLTQGTWLEGAVTDPAGKPVPGALVRAFRGPFENPNVVVSEVWSETKAGGDGRYRLHLEPGTYDVQVRQPGAGVIRHPKVELAAKEQKRLDLQLAKGVTLRAHVRDSVTGEPVEGFVLWNWAQPGIEGTSDASGLLEITGLTEGDFDFNVTAKGEDRRRSNVAGKYARWWSPSAVREHQREETDRQGFRRNFDDLTFRLEGDVVEAAVFAEPAVTLRGRVLDPDGKPVAGATVAPAKTGSGNSLTGDTRFSYETDADGKFEMRLPASGDAEYNLVAHDGKYGEWRTWANGYGEPFQTTPGQTIGGLELRLTRPAVVRGRVTTPAGKPRAGVEVRAAADDARDNRYYLPTVKTDADGRYELKFVSPGKHLVQAAPFWLQAREAPDGTSRAVEVAPGDVVEGVNLKADPG